MSFCLLLLGCKNEQSLVNSLNNSEQASEPSQGKTESEISDDCIFDMAKQNDDFLKKVPEFSKYDWNDSLKTANVTLANGDHLEITRGGCYHYSVLGKYKYSSKNAEISDLNYWFEQCKWLSKRIMSLSEYKLLSENIEAKNYNLQIEQDKLFVHFSNHDNSEWYLEVNNNEVGIHMETGYYFD